VTVAANAPAAVGVNAKVLVQLAPAASGLTQVDAVRENELAPEPVIVVDSVKLTATVPVFLIVTTCVAALVPTVVEGKLRLDGVIESIGVAGSMTSEYVTTVVCTESFAVRLNGKVPDCVGVPLSVTMAAGEEKLMPVGSVPLGVSVAIPSLPTAENVWL
jgi:hypothetical protein